MASITKTDSKSFQDGYHIASVANLLSICLKILTKY